MIVTLGYNLLTMMMLPKSNVRVAYVVITNDTATPVVGDTMADFCDANDPLTDLSYSSVVLTNRRKNEFTVEAQIGKPEAVFTWTKIGLISNEGALLAQQAYSKVKTNDKEVTLRWRIKFNAQT